eukprot:c23740_g1_i1 orf=524-2311(+)
MAECKVEKGCAAGNGMVGMVIAGRAARACDGCMKERARWYCAADLAYLCEHCDAEIHTANTVARRHERVRLGPNGAPMKIARAAQAINAKQATAAAADAQPPAVEAHLNPRKRPRSIRRHKQSSVHASKHSISSSYHSTSSIFASNHSLMINNPRNDPEFVINNNDIMINKVFIKAEPMSPTSFGDQVKVPDHTEDDPLLESLFDFRDLQEDDHFLHEVPIYIPLQSQDLPPTLMHSDQQCADEEEIKPTLTGAAAPHEKSNGNGHLFNNNSSCAIDNSYDNLLNSSSACAIGHSSVLPQTQGADDDDSKGLISLVKCDVSDRFIDNSDNDLCDLDQLDFDSMLHGHDEDGEEMDHDATMDAFHEHVKSDNYTDISQCHTARDGTNGYAEDGNSYADDSYGNGMDDNIDEQYEGDHAGYGEVFEFDTTGSESPRTWLCKVKVETPPDLGIMQGNSDRVEIFLREKLTCTSLSTDSPNGFKLGLRLNFEDVLNAWSDRGTFWMDGQPPDQLSSCLDFLQEMSSTIIAGEGQQLVHMLHHKSKKVDGGAREASVLRYREKRRTRLFSKKIRYEVRKLNAEKRPRMKGRFVKRISIVA